MNQKRWMPWVGAAFLVVALAVVVAGCGGGGGSSSSSSSGGGGTSAGTGTTGGSATGKKIKVGLVTDIGGLNDRSFNHLAYVGLQRAQSQLGVEGRVLTSGSNADYVPNLSTLARQHYDLIIGVGFLMTDAVNTVAKKFPDAHFAGVDMSIGDLKSKPSNFAGIKFKEQESGYVAGYLAGLLEKGKVAGAGKANTISSVGGQKIPPVDHYIAGYIAGAKKADPGIKVLNAYSQSFTDQTKCKSIALNQISQGSDIIFQVAGGCGLGALDAAKAKGLWGIGVDADQAYLGPHILTSAIKKVDVGVFDTIKADQDGSFKGGADTFFDIANGGAGIGKISSKVPASIVSQVQKVQEQIKSGAIPNIPDTVK
jgi:basic membrane protein A and related proteins